jgi:hypothetical protein
MRLAKLIAGGLLVAVAIAVVSGSRSDGAKSSAPAVRDIHALYAFPPEDTRRLVGFAENVFLGTVVRAAGEQRIDTSSPDAESFVPMTTYVVRVDRNLKGKLAGEVTVAQAGGTDPVDGAQLRVDGDPPMTVGQPYLLITRFDQARGWHTIVAPRWANLPITADTLASLVTRYRDAVRSEIRFDLRQVTADPPEPPPTSQGVDGP